MLSIERAGALSRAWMTLLVTILLFVPGIVLALPNDNGAEEDILNDEPPTRQTWLDIRVEDIRVKRTSESNNIYPGQRIRIDVELVHDDLPRVSDTPISRYEENEFDTILVVDDTFDNVTTQYKRVTSMSTNYTGVDQPGPNVPNPPYVITFYFTVPERPPSEAASWNDFQFQLIASITVDDDDKSDNFRTGAGLRISEPDFAPFIYEEGQEEGEYESPKPTKVDVGKYVFIPFQLQNNANAIDFIGVEILSYPEGWGVKEFVPDVVYPNNYKQYDLPVQVPDNPFLALHGEKYRIVARAYSEFYPEGPYDEVSTHTFIVTVNFKPKVEIYPETPQVYLPPGETSDVIFYLRNMGNGLDSYTLRENVDDVHTRKGWKVSIGGQTSLQSDVKPDERKEILVKVYVPASAPRFYNVYLVLDVVSNGPVTYQEESEVCVLFADIRYSAKIEEFDDPFFVRPGKENKIWFNFTNEGNDKDPNQRLEVSYRPKGWGVFIDQTPLKAKTGLGPRTTAYLEMTVFVEETTVSSEKANLPFIIIQALGGPNYDRPHVLDEVRYYFEIPLVRNLELTTEENHKVGFVGGQVEYMVNVRNTGNWLDTFNISVDSDWADFEVDMSDQTIAPNETYPVKLVVEIPFDAAADTDPDTPNPHPYYNWYDGYEIRISGYSQNETEQGSTLTHLKLEVHVQPFYNFEMRIDPNEPELKFSTDHDEARAVRVEVINTGNIMDTIQLDWEDLPVEYSTWIRLQNNYVDIEFGGTSYAVININPRANTIKEPGIISFNLTGISQRDSSQKPVTYNLEIKLEFYRMEFEIYDEKLNTELINGYKNTWEKSDPPGIKLETPRKYLISVKVRNTGDVDLTPARFDTLYVILEDNAFEVDTANITYLPAGEETNISFLWSSVIPGPHNFVVRFEGDVPVSDRGVTEKEFTIEVRSPPKPTGEQDPEVPLLGVIIPLILIVIFATAAFVFINRFNQIYISPIDTGYDESGEYRPWAVKEKLKGEPEQLSQPQEKPALPEKEKPALPAAPKQGHPGPAPQQPPRPPQGQPRPAPQQPPRPPQGHPGPAPQQPQEKQQ
ncbi:MAG: hypothetical protein R6V01_07090 [Thermoplasmatota archaeon]